MNKQTEQLEKNELVEWLDQKFGHLRPYLGQIFFGVIALVALVFAAAFLIKSRADLQATQWQELSSRINDFSLDRQTSHLLNLAEEFPEAESSMWALQLAGDVELRNGLSTLNSDTAAMRNLEKAKKAYQKLLDSPVKKNPELIQRATYSLAYCLESLGEFDEAKKIYQKIVDEAASSVYGDPSKLALTRLAQPDIVAFYDAYKKTAVAPMGELPKRPDITFPELPAETGSTDNAPAGEAAAANPPASAPTAGAAAAESGATESGAAEPGVTEAGAGGSAPAGEENAKKDGGE